MLEGITAGFILSLALFPGTVWLIKIGRSGSRSQVFTIGVALALSQFFWICASAPGLMMMTKNLSFLRAGMYWFAAFVLTYMGVKILRSPKVTDLTFKLPKDLSKDNLFNTTLARAVAMPMRLPATVAILMATGVFINNDANTELVVYIVLGALVGILWWWGQFAILAAFFVKRVPLRVTLRSLNRIRMFSGILFFLLALICILISG